jgi:hypothetical protein
MDSAFCSKSNNFVIKSIANVHDCDGARQLRFQREATSMRQAAEWGMRALQGSFPRLKSPIRYEEFGERRQILETAVLLFNWRANTVGINQLRTVFMGPLYNDTDVFVDGILHST